MKPFNWSEGAMNWILSVAVVWLMGLLLTVFLGMLTILAVRWLWYMIESLW